MTKAPLSVAHYAGTYLLTTTNWIYQQLINLAPTDFIFLTRNRQNASDFPIQHLYSLDSLPLAHRVVQLVHYKAFGYFRYHVDACLAHNVELLHIHFGYHGAKMVGLKRKLQLPMVCSFYGDDAYAEEFASRSHYEALFKLADKILVLGPSMKAKVVELGCSEEKVIIHHLGIGVDKIPYKKREHGQRLKFLIASSFLEKKGVHIALNALAQIASELDFEVEIIGDGPLRSEIEGIITSSGLADRVKMHGYQSYGFLIEAALRCDVFIQASQTTRDNRKEGTPMAIADVMATGMPVVSTEHSDIPELVMENSTGYLAKEGDVDSLVAKLRSLFQMKERLIEMGGNARKHVEHDFNVKNQAERLNKMYRKLVKTKAD